MIVNNSSSSTPNGPTAFAQGSTSSNNPSNAQASSSVTIIPAATSVQPQAPTPPANTTAQTILDVIRALFSNIPGMNTPPATPTTPTTPTTPATPATPSTPSTPDHEGEPVVLSQPTLNMINDIPGFRLENNKLILDATSETTAAQLEDALTIAATNDVEIKINGTITIDTPIIVRASTNLTVDAKNATFIAAEGLDGGPILDDEGNPRLNNNGQPRVSSGDMIRIQGTSSNNEEDVHIDWTGGIFDVSNAQNATEASPRIGAFTRGDSESAMRRSARRGDASTTDALSIRGVNGGTQGIDSASVDQVRVIGLPVADRNAPFEELAAPEGEVRQEFPDAGGDSGVFIQGLDYAQVTNSEFYGTRDAAIYLTSSPANSGLVAGTDFVATGNKITHSFDGISAKRGADRIIIDDNQLKNVQVGISTKSANEEEGVLRFIQVTNNEIDTTQQGILLERSDYVTVTGNTITNLGAVVAEDNFSSDNDGYVGILLEGVGGGDLTPARIVQLYTGDEPELEGLSEAERALKIGQIRLDDEGNPIKVANDNLHEVSGNTIEITEDATRLAQLERNTTDRSDIAGIIQRDFTGRTNNASFNDDREAMPLSIAEGDNNLVGNFTTTLETIASVLQAMTQEEGETPA